MPRQAARIKTTNCNPAPYFTEHELYPVYDTFNICGVKCFHTIDDTDRITTCRIKGDSYLDGGDWEIITA